jgi:hypothetical protein
MARRTLCRWKSKWKKGRLCLPGRGRPAHRSDVKIRQRLLALMDLLGPRVGVPTLQACFPRMARREVQDIVRRYRTAWQRRRRLLTRVLYWRRPGSVWAIDFAEPPLPVDGCFGRLLAVRDLASGFQLLWLPATDESAKTAVAALEMLFHQHGPPLVLKSDNGSAFIAGATQRLLAKWHVCHLRSPPEWPEYNGACEAGIGSMKARTHHESSRRAHPGNWTCDDVEAARLQANQTARPWGLHGPTPLEAWRQHRLISARERRVFGKAVDRHETEATRISSAAPNRSQAVAIRRIAIGHALVAFGLLDYRQEGNRIRSEGVRPAGMNSRM